MQKIHLYFIYYILPHSHFLWVCSVHFFFSTFYFVLSLSSIHFSNTLSPLYGSSFHFFHFLIHVVVLPSTFPISIIHTFLPLSLSTSSSTHPCHFLPPPFLPPHPRLPPTSPLAPRPRPPPTPSLVTTPSESCGPPSGASSGSPAG